MATHWLVSHLYHLLMLVAMVYCMRLGIYISTLSKLEIDSDKTGQYAPNLMFILRLPMFLMLPYYFFNITGFVLYNPFGGRSVDKVYKTEDFICFRVVTRGLFPNLVRRTVQRNLETCYKCGLQNFKFEVVTDMDLNLPTSKDVRVTLVPETYKTPRGSLYKARALNYCLESDVNILSENDWVVHLDEETILTESCIDGLQEFIHDSETSGAVVGQGAILYAREDIPSWLTTFGEGIRVAIDYGLMRLTLQRFGRPLFFFKGSYILVKSHVEQDVTFDFGPDGSLAEDQYFALAAWHKGYKFGFINGVMHEKGCFTVFDYVKQRQRWFLGHFRIIWRCNLPRYTKLGMITTNMARVLIPICTPLTVFFPLHMPVPINIITGAMYGCSMFMFQLGNCLQFGARSRRLFVVLLMIIFSPPLLLFFGILDATATFAGLIKYKTLTFYIVRKEPLPRDGAPLSVLSV